MDENLISKKELLDKYKISYGALYRWKRMGLIPDDWFIRRSTPTGQETFFHSAQVCPRVELILSRRDISLEALAGELCVKEEKRPKPKLTVTTRFSTKTYPLDELVSVVFGDEETKIDILSIIKENYNE